SAVRSLDVPGTAEHLTRTGGASIVADRQPHWRGEGGCGFDQPAAVDRTKTVVLRHLADIAPRQRSERTIVLLGRSGFPRLDAPCPVLRRSRHGRYAQQSDGADPAITLARFRR